MLKFCSQIFRRNMLPKLYHVVNLIKKFNNPTTQRLQTQAVFREIFWLFIVSLQLLVWTSIKLLEWNLNMFDINNCHRSIIISSSFPGSYHFRFRCYCQCLFIQSHDLNYLSTEWSMFQEGCIDRSLLLQISPWHLILVCVISSRTLSLWIVQITPKQISSQRLEIDWLTANLFRNLISFWP